MGEIKGRRRKDRILDLLPSNLQPGDYWKLINEDGTPLKATYPSNLTGMCWRVVVPLGKGFGLGTLMKHTVREHEDGTISVRFNDGSSNSILISKPDGTSWHGFIEHGIFKES